MSCSSLSACAIALLFLCAEPLLVRGQPPAQSKKGQNAPAKGPSPIKQPSPEEQLQQAISNSGTDRAALVRNLEAYLKQYPESRQRPQIYRALVEACMQLRDNARAANYAERIIA